MCRRAALDAPKKLPAAQKKRYEELERRLNVLKPARPKAPAAVMAVTDVGRSAPPTRRLQGGNWRRPREEMALVCSGMNRAGRNPLPQVTTAPGPAVLMRPAGGGHNLMGAWRFG